MILSIPPILYNNNILLQYGRVSSLETITEEETSKESSPTFPSSPIPSRVCPTSYSSSEDVIEEKEVVTEADVDQALRLLQRVTGSEELQRMFKQIQDSRSGSGDIETELVSPTRAKGSSLSSPEVCVYIYYVVTYLNIQSLDNQ